MGADSKIEWTDHTFNPWWGCARVSPACEHCYAEAFAKRTGHAVWGLSAPRRFFGAKHWAEPLRWNADAEREGVRRRVFCASMADVFEEPGLVEVAAQLDAARAQLWCLIHVTPHLDWLLLTKRPENIASMVPEAWITQGFPPNVWVGTTVEDQKRANERIYSLLKIPAVVRFLSCEPLLGTVDLEDLVTQVPVPGQLRKVEFHFSALRRNQLCLPPDPFARGIQWVIVGGESGPGARDFDFASGLRLVQDCRHAGVPVFFKQAGARPRSYDGTLLKLQSRRGSDLDEVPAGLRIRQFPGADS